MQRREFIHKTAAGVAAIGIPTIVPASVFGKNAPSNKINVAQIGCGRIAREHDLPGTMQHDLGQVMAVCDLDANRLQEGKQFIESYYAKKTGSASAINVKTYADYRELLLNKDIDAVVISTPDHWHSQPAMEAALAGKHVYLQLRFKWVRSSGRRRSFVSRRSWCATGALANFIPSKLASLVTHQALPRPKCPFPKASITICGWVLRLLCHTPR